MKIKSAEVVTFLLQAATQQTDYLNHPRILRCIVFLAKGNIDELRRQIEIAAYDPRDVMMAAEYERPMDKSPLRIRNFNEPFEHNPA
jgi:hypothetical protein